MTLKEPIPTGRPLKLHLGCGRRKLPGYLHVDSRPEVAPDRVCDASNLDWCTDESVDLIYASHILEHFRRPLTFHVLREWFRVLIPGGVLRVSVPDIGNIMRAYVHGEVSLPRLQGLIWGRQDYLANTHYWGWDYETLANELREAGFYEVGRWSPWQAHPEGYHDISFAQISDSVGRWHQMSLNLEAKKVGA